MTVNLADLLRCPISKQPMERNGSAYVAPAGFRYEAGDFRVPLNWSPEWERGQLEYERWVDALLTSYESAPSLMDETDEELLDVYGQIELPGLVLDVGGYPGMVIRQAGLSAEQYVSIDPIKLDPESFPKKYPTFAAHYPECAGVARIQGVAEFLPLPDLSFDTVHMRSCLDHFAAPQIALKEAFRVLKPGGKLVVGIALEGAFHRNAASSDAKGARAVYRATAELLRRRTPRLAQFLARVMLRQGSSEDYHIFHPTHDSLLALLRDAHFEVVAEVWQAAYHNVIYVDARKPGRLSGARA